MPKLIAAGVAALGLLFLASSARATPLTAGGNVTPDTSQETGTLVTTVAGTFTGGGVLQGTVQESVFREAGGTLDFVYQAHITHSVLVTLEADDYAGFTTNVSMYSTAGGFSTGTHAATSASRTPDGHNVNFHFGAGVGGITFVMIVRTNATAYRTGNINLIDHGVGSHPGLAPSPTPEPTSLLLLGGLTLGIGGVRLRRWWKGRPTTP